MIEDITIPNVNDVKEKISLIDGIRASFGNELLKKAKISTNDSLINALINRY